MKIGFIQNRTVMLILMAINRQIRPYTLFDLLERQHMTKRLFFILGVIAGILFAVIGYRKRMERLRVLEAEKAAKTARYAEYNREWQAELATMPFEKRMDWELFQTSLKLSNYQPDWDEEDYDDEESH
jgi:hypothetical protein